MTLKHEIEADRLALQERLDQAKTQEERNKLGQFATPTDLAFDILNVAKQYFQPNVWRGDMDTSYLCLVAKFLAAVSMTLLISNCKIASDGSQSLKEVDNQIDAVTH